MQVQRLPEWEELLSIIRVKFPHFMEKDEIKDSSFYRTLCQAVGDRIQVKYTLIFISPARVMLPV